MSRPRRPLRGELPWSPVPMPPLVAGLVAAFIESELRDLAARVAREKAMYQAAAADTIWLGL